MSESESETILRIVMNSETGEVGLGIKLAFMNKRQEHELDNLPGFSIQLAPTKPDAWALFAGADDAEGPWMMVSKPEYLEKIEDIGPL